MRTIRANNVNDAISEALWWLRVVGVREDSRNGPVLVAPGPVMTVYSQPQQRILWEPKRDANPVFHLMESIWMLAGVSGVDFLLPFNARMKEYAEVDGRIHGAYGWRWRDAFGFDQLLVVLDELKNPSTRQAVLAMWDPVMDLGEIVRDKPCNTHIYFDRRGDVLNMTACCRSNDIIWGAYGANVVHMSFLQQFMAEALCIPVGVYRQFSNNFHLYLENETAAGLLASPPDFEDEYIWNSDLCVPLIGPGETPDDFLTDCENMVIDAPVVYITQFIREIAAPLRHAYLERKAGRPWSTSGVLDCDWKLAFEQWAGRRESRV